MLVKCATEQLAYLLWSRLVDANTASVHRRSSFEIPRNENVCIMYMQKYVCVMFGIPTTRHLHIRIFINWFLIVMKYICDAAIKITFFPIVLRIWPCDVRRKKKQHFLPHRGNKIWLVACIYLLLIHAGIFRILAQIYSSDVIFIPKPNIMCRIWIDLKEKKKTISRSNYAVFLHLHKF